ncbi:MAG: sodium:calcium antiporter [Deltaproteobacteria bacterium]
MLTNVIILIVSLIVILISCELFTNAIEWFGKKLKVGEGVVGSIFAAVGTCLPETLVPIIAIFSGSVEGAEVGIGAIAGAPFMLSTLAFFITGLAVVLYSAGKRRTTEMNINVKIIGRDIMFFIFVYSVAILASFVKIRMFHYCVAGFLLLAYVYYVYLTSKRDSHSDSELEELTLAKLFKCDTKMGIILSQLAVAMTGIIIGAEFFVKAMESTAHLLNISPLIIALILAPVATELPEKFNSVIWIGRKKDTLALGNITGAMVFQSCIPVSVGLLFTSWDLNNIALFSALVSILSAFMNYVMLKFNNKMSPYVLMLSGFFYLSLIAYIIINLF